MENWQNSKDKMAKQYKNAYYSSQSSQSRQTKLYSIVTLANALCVVSPPLTINGTTVPVTRIVKLELTLYTLIEHAFQQNY
jgi:hypothetical protein